MTTKQKPRKARAKTGELVEVLHYASAGATRKKITHDLRAVAINAAAAVDTRDKWERAADNHAAADHNKLFPPVPVAS